MGQLGMWEIAAIFIVALLVFGPKKLPELGKSLGKGLREFKRATNDLKSSWEDQVREIDREVSSATREVKNVGRDLEKDLQNSIKDNSANGAKPAAETESTPAPDAPVAADSTLDSVKDRPSAENGENAPAPGPVTPAPSKTAPASEPVAETEEKSSEKPS